MNVCILRGPGCDSSIVARAIQAARDRQLEAFELLRPSCTGPGAPQTSSTRFHETGLSGTGSLLVDSTFAIGWTRMV